MFEYVNGTGYDVVELGNNQWLLDVKGFRKYHGTLKEVLKFCVKKYGFELSELEFAVETMISSGHNAATFGAYKTFIYSFNHKAGYVKKAS